MRLIDKFDLSFRRAIYPENEEMQSVYGADNSSPLMSAFYVPIFMLRTAYENVRRAVRSSVNDDYNISN